MPDLSESTNIIGGGLGSAFAPKWTRSLASEMKRRGIWQEGGEGIQMEDPRLSLMRKVRSEGEAVEKSQPQQQRQASRPQEQTVPAGALAGRILHEARKAVPPDRARESAAQYGDQGGQYGYIQADPSRIQRPADAQAWGGQRGSADDAQSASGLGGALMAKAAGAIPQAQRARTKTPMAVYGRHGSAEPDGPPPRVEMAARRAPDDFVGALDSALDGVLAAAGLAKAEPAPQSTQSGHTDGPTIMAHPSGGHVIEFEGDVATAAHLWREYHQAMGALGASYAHGETFRHENGGTTQVIVYSGPGGPSTMVLHIPQDGGASSVRKSAGGPPARLHVHGPDLRAFAG